jgi:hypothetical protein
MDILHLNRSLSIETTGSQVPYKSLNQDRAAFMPDAVQAVSRYPLNLSRKNRRLPGFDIIFRSRHLINGSFAFAFLIHT